MSRHTSRAVRILHSSRNILEPLLGESEYPAPLPSWEGQSGGAAESKAINNRRGRWPGDPDNAMDSSTSRTRRSRAGNIHNTAGNRTDRGRVGSRPAASAIPVIAVPIASRVGGTRKRDRGNGDGSRGTQEHPKIASLNHFEKALWRPLMGQRFLLIIR